MTDRDAYLRGVDRKPRVQRPNPAERMAALLADERAALGREPLGLDFRAAWDRSWATMVDERAWPHATKHRRAWREAMNRTRPKCRAAFIAGADFGEWVAVCAERKQRVIRLAALLARSRP